MKFHIAHRRLRRSSSVVLLAATIVVGCASESSPEEQVRAVLAQAEEGAEARDVSEVMALVSEEYADRRGLDKAQLERFVRGYFVMNQSIHLLMRVEELEFPADELARARVLVGMLGTRADAGNDWDLAADVYDFDIELVLEDGEWRLRYADWRPARQR